MSSKIINIALEKDIVISSLKVALVVGCILNIINQGDALVHMNLESISWFKLGLTFVVPYMVSTYASVRVKTVTNQ